MIEDLQRLLSLSAALDKPKVERSPRADTKKNRLALAQACRAQAIEPLRRLLDLGAPVNFLVEEKWNGLSDRTLLGICAESGWASGARALIEAGADERLIPEFGSPLKIHGRDQTLTPFAHTAAHHGHAEIFSLSIPLHSRHDLESSLARCRHPGIFMAARSAGLSDLVPRESKVDLLLACIEGIDPSSDPGSPPALCFDALLAELAPRRDADLANALWLEALELGSPGAIQGLASRNLAPLDNWRVRLVPKKDLSATGAPAELASSKLSGGGRYSWESWEWKAAANAPIILGVASAAAAFAAVTEKPHALRALCAIEPLRRELFASALGRHYLSRIVDVDTHKRLAALGMDLALARSTEGQNPLHWAARQKQPKQNMEALARACSAWIDQADEAGKRPIDLVADPERKQSLAVSFDQIGMREALGGKRGARPTPTTRRRL